MAPTSKSIVVSAELELTGMEKYISSPHVLADAEIGRVAQIASAVYKCTCTRSPSMARTKTTKRITRRHHSAGSLCIALRENGRPIAGGRFLCAEYQAVPSSRWTGLVEAVTSPDQKGNRYTNRARVNNSPSKGRGTRRIGATRASNLEDQTRFLYGVFPGNGLVVDPACGLRPGPQVIVGEFALADGKKTSISKSPGAFRTAAATA